MTPPIPFPFTLYNISSDSAAGGGGGVTRLANLDHWWPMSGSAADGDPPTQLTDVATNGTTRRNLGASNLTIVNNGRTLGSNTFDTYDFNGTNGESRNANQSTFMDSEISITCWVKLDTVSLYESIYSVGVVGGGWNSGLMIYYTGASSIANGYASGQALPANSIVFGSNGYSNSSAGNSSTAYHTGSVAVGSWHHVAAVLNVSTATQKIYVNGVAGNDAAVTPISPGSEVKQMSIGSLSYGATNVGFFLDGQLSDFRLYNIALSAAEVAAIYAGDFDVG